MGDLWQDCLICVNKCCKWDIAYPLFLIPSERQKNKMLNIKHPCVYLNDRKLCTIHKSRLFDCRFFLFDIMKIDEKFIWILWNMDCLIIKKWRNNFEKYLNEYEKELIPWFADYLEDYAIFRVEELKSKYKYEVLREVIIKF